MNYIFYWSSTTFKNKYSRAHGSCLFMISVRWLLAGFGKSHAFQIDVIVIQVFQSNIVHPFRTYGTISSPEYEKYANTCKCPKCSMKFEPSSAVSIGESGVPAWPSLSLLDLHEVIRINCVEFITIFQSLFLRMSASVKISSRFRMVPKKHGIKCVALQRPLVGGFQHR